MRIVRAPARAGQFYQGEAAALRRQLEWCFAHQMGPGQLPADTVEPRETGRSLGIISPHAGYMYSGPAAAWAFRALAVAGRPQALVLLGPNHTGLGVQVAVSNASGWQTPLGEVPVDQELASELCRRSGLLVLDEAAHRFEHSLEVQLPFLQYIYSPPVPVVPICLGVSSWPDAQELGQALAEAGKQKELVIIASTDFSHQVPQQVAERLDGMALERVLALDPEGLLALVAREGITMCGPMPVAVMLTAALAMGADSARLLRYYTSGEIAGGMGGVVGYASVLIRRQGDDKCCC